MTQVLVFVPGLMGSELWDADGKLWPGTARDWAFGYADVKFDRLCANDLEPRDIIRKAVGIVNIYDCWISAFSNLSDYHTNEPLFVESGDVPTLFTVPYDWRKSIAVGAMALAKVIARVADLHGVDAEIHLVAHSMGGLVARYFLQSDAFQATPGLDRIVSFLTFGTPHRGAVVALAAALGHKRADFMSVEQSRTLANDPRFQGLYNLFPQMGARPIWERGGAGRLRAHDVFEPDIAGALGLNAQSLSDTSAVHDTLATTWPDIRTFMFVGTRFETMTHILWDGFNSVVVKTRDSGDGTVNLHGAMLENQQILFTDKNHGALIKSDETREALQDIFNAYGILLARDAMVSLTVSDHFIESEQTIEILVTVSSSGAAIHGKLYLERARIDPKLGDELSDSDFDASAGEFARELRYDGPDLVMMNVEFEGVQGPAAFRPVFETDEVTPRRFVGTPFLVKAPH
ncbi:esterase/lipase family protein [Gluconobacter albidus]|uniref:esterase/lipase family protein n=1 Tax=Gluconobacter albidus TaxID=318683 RepID=UPI001428C3A2|nr:hypothetical protein [Gluconobacter albidus]